MRPRRLSLLSALSAVALSTGVAAGAPGSAPAAAAPVPGARSSATKAPPPAPQAELTPAGALARATAFYESGQYVDCADAFAALLDDEALAGGLAFRSREQARVYRAACLIAQSKIAAADEQFRIAIRESPQMAAPSSIVFPQPVLERFFVVRSALLEEIRHSEEERAERQRVEAERTRRRAADERARVLLLEKLAGEETIVTKNRRWLASVPFGVGQFQNRDYALGGVFMVSELLLTATAISAVSVELSLHSQAKGGTALNNTLEGAQLNQNLRTAHDVGLVALGGLVLAVAGGIVQANVAYVPEFTDGVRPRKKSRADGQSPSFTPAVTPTTEGASIGVTGRF